ncbi:DNA cytosine methyltransferase [Frateuria sp. GZRe12]|uniref:DNA cytosine methyltransferase n=1 Tax=Frateuria sp. GZRe12 TaxID=3351533 RepID=UPI003EDC474A
MSRQSASRSSVSQVELPLRLEQKKSGASDEVPDGVVHRVAGLFAGIGGVERGLARAGHEALFFCENDPGAMAVLEDRFSHVSLHDDIRTLKRVPDGTSLVVAGFPCQDLSQAGTTKGLAGARSGLVGEVFRLIEKHRTSWVLLENVPFMLQLGQGEAMHVITSRLEALGYRWAYRVVDSRAFGLPQRRRRVYLLASLEGDPRNVLFADEAGAQPEPLLNGHPVACGFYWTEGLRGLGWAVDAVPTLKGGSGIGIPSPPAIWMPDGSLVTPDIRDAERLQGFPANWTRTAETVVKKGARWKLVGNAVSVPAAVWIGRRMRKPGRLLDLPVMPMQGHRKWPTAAWNVGQGRHVVSISEWPMRRATPPLNEFLKYAVVPLSAKATGGFLERTRRAKLRFPHGFIHAVERHLATVSG